MRPAAITTLLPLLALAACKERLPDGPRPTAVTPASAPNSAATAVQITGTSFEPHVTVDYDKARSSRVDDHFLARLGPDHDLEQVRWVSTTELTAEVPAGLPPGVYDLTLTDPRGDTGTLASAFTVLGPGDGGADGDGPADASPADGALEGAPDLPLTDARPPDQMPPDSPVVYHDLGPCPAVCSSCSGATCKLPCASGCVCPPGWSCDIDCWAKICVGAVDCSAAADCSLKCASTSCTGLVTCGSGRCDVTCASGSCLGGVDCAKSCACTVSCASGACGPGVTCPPACNNKCSSSDACDNCP